ncbi:putative nitronate monooxygenase [Chloropicon primus]|uniref:Putative nitronate monooxygenase n=1 Tax=Chloropicon primus TaxID=1764295 RepID=A0A5B8N1A9_9CHLO|nr:putative nitronate monooxygenase [Chloropicon primus]UPR05277.1 putative nitronate monooxygenase [Chloropicon primus]|eukprot:QDZ26076.1 putative nitronate monooxygenase [Chloropicon primus]
MAGASGGLLAASTARAGGLGSIAMPMLRKDTGEAKDPCGSLAKLREEVRIFRAGAPAAPLCIGFVEDHCLQRRGDFSLILDAVAEHEPEFVQVFAPASTSLVQSIRGAHSGVRIMAQVGSSSEAKRVIGEAKVDVVIAQGKEAGGHGLRPEMSSGTLPFARRVVQLAEGTGTLVLAAGGIVDGAGAAAALVLGCDGAVLGTRLWATEQALGDQEKKNRLPAADCDDVVRTRLYDKLNNKCQKEETNGLLWRHPYDTCGVIRPETWAEDATKSWTTEEARAYLKSNFALAGDGVGSINGIEDAEEIVKNIAGDMSSALVRASSLVS